MYSLVFFFYCLLSSGDKVVSENSEARKVERMEGRKVVGCRRLERRGEIRPQRGANSSNNAAVMSVHVMCFLRQRCRSAEKITVPMEQIQIVCSQVLIHLSMECYYKKLL